MWEPALDGALASQARDCIHQIARDLMRPDDEDSALLLDGAAGIALFLGHYAKEFGESAASSACCAHLEKAIDGLSDVETHPGLFVGAAGISWVAAHLNRLEILPDDIVDNSFDEGLVAAVRASDWRDQFDLFGGLVGVGIYALERLPARSGQDLAQAVLEQLRLQSHHDRNGAYWLTSPTIAAARGATSARYVNLGVAHGIPAVASFLLRARAHNLMSGASSDLLHSCLSWLLAKQSTRERSDDSTPVFGMSVGLEPHPASLPMAWCYGDLGIAAALSVQASSDNTALDRCQSRLCSVLEHTNILTPMDASLCHGSGGIGHLFARLANRYQSDILMHLSALWYERALQARGTSGVGGFRFWRKREWRDERGFLRGAAGLGLALLSATSASDPSWDRALCASG